MRHKIKLLLDAARAQLTPEASDCPETDLQMESLGRKFSRILQCSVSRGEVASEAQPAASRCPLPATGWLGTSHQEAGQLCRWLGEKRAESGSPTVLIACEFSGTVRNAFAAAGCIAVSCDILPTEAPGDHYQGDVREILHLGWDLMVAHPPCTHLAVSGARWFKEKKAEQEAALDFVARLMAAPIPQIAIENPVSIISSRLRKPDQTIQPWQFGHGETKATCLWLKGLPKLKPTNIVAGRNARVFHEPPSPERWKNRSRTLPGIAAAMSEQWKPLSVLPRRGQQACRANDQALRPARSPEQKGNNEK